MRVPYRNELAPSHGPDETAIQSKRTKLEALLGMARQTTKNRGQGRAILRAGVGRIVFWAPVWVPLIVVYQITLGGLKPTLAEGERVHAAEDEVQQRVDQLEAERSDLETRREMLNDPIYRARVERTKHRADRQPLTLEEALDLVDSKD